MRGGVSHHLKSIGQQAIARQNGSRLVIGLVDGRAAAAQIIIIHGRQIVMDQRIAVDHLQSAGGAHGDLRLHPEEGRRLDDKKGPQTLAPTQRRMAHGSQQAGRAAHLSRAGSRRQKALQSRFHLISDGCEPQLECGAQWGTLSSPDGVKKRAAGQNCNPSPQFPVGTLARAHNPVYGTRLEFERPPNAWPPMETTMAVPKRKTSPMKRGFRRSADALAQPTYVEDKDSGELRRPHHVDLKTGMYRGRQILKVKSKD